MGDYKWWRWLRGGIWVLAWQSWHKVAPEKYKDALSLTIFRVEDHRYFKPAVSQKGAEESAVVTIPIARCTRPCHYPPELCNRVDGSFSKGAANG